MIEFSTVDHKLRGFTNEFAVMSARGFAFHVEALLVLDHESALDITVLHPGVWNVQTALH